MKVQTARRWLEQADSRGEFAAPPPRKKRKQPAHSKASPEALEALLQIERETKGGLPYDVLAMRMAQAGFDVSRWTVWRWSKMLRGVRRKVYPRPLLTLAHMADRIDHVLNDIDPSTGMMTDHHENVHLDEKKFQYSRRARDRRDRAAQGRGAAAGRCADKV